MELTDSAALLVAVGDAVDDEADCDQGVVVCGGVREAGDVEEDEEARGSDAWKPVARERVVSNALKAYAALTTSAARGAVRDISQLEK